MSIAAEKEEKVYQLSMKSEFWKVIPATSWICNFLESKATNQHISRGNHYELRKSPTPFTRKQCMGSHIDNGCYQGRLLDS